MSDRFFIADLHLGHRGMIQFVRSDGTPQRPEWGRADPDRLMPNDEATERTEAMNEAMIERWNAVVGPKCIVEVLGDVVINRRALSLVGRLNGRKRLRMGNHDIFVKKHNLDYQPYFEEITAYKVMVKEKLVLSHIPLHSTSVGQRWLANVHGHLHDGRVMTKRDIGVMRCVSIPGTHRLSSPSPVWVDVPDTKYLCVSAERVNFAPISLEEVYVRIAAQKAESDEIVRLAKPW